MPQIPTRRLSLPAIGLLASCLGGARDDGASAARTEVADAMQRYQAAARGLNPDSMAAFYTETATLFEPGINPVRTRDSIRAFIASFPGARVEVATATPDTIELYAGTAFLWGSYFERLSFP